MFSSTEYKIVGGGGGVLARYMIGMDDSGFECEKQYIIHVVVVRICGTSGCIIGGGGVPL